MHRLVEDLLALTRLDEGKLVLRKDTIDLRTLLEKMYDHAQQLGYSQDIHLAVSLSRARPSRSNYQRHQQFLTSSMCESFQPGEHISMCIKPEERL